MSQTRDQARAAGVVAYRDTPAGRVYAAGTRPFAKGDPAPIARPWEWNYLGAAVAWDADPAKARPYRSAWHARGFVVGAGWPADEVRTATVGELAVSATESRARVKVYAKSSAANSGKEPKARAARAPQPEAARSSAPAEADQVDAPEEPHHLERGYATAREERAKAERTPKARTATAEERSALGIEIGDVVTTSYGTGPYQVASVSAQWSIYCPACAMEHHMPDGPPVFTIAGPDVRAGHPKGTFTINSLRRRDDGSIASVPPPCPHPWPEGWRRREDVISVVTPEANARQVATYNAIRPKTGEAFDQVEAASYGHAARIFEHRHPGRAYIVEKEGGEDQAEPDVVILTDLEAVLEAESESDDRSQEPAPPATQAPRPRKPRPLTMRQKRKLARGTAPASRDVAGSDGVE